MMNASIEDKPLIGISSCLVGEKVRFDGGHKNSRSLRQLLEDKVEFMTLCPEMGMGLGVPRPAIQLRRVDEDMRLVVSKFPDQDLTSTMQDYASRKIEELSDLDGFIFKKDSPSCGVFRVPVVINEEGYRSRDGIGLFAKAFTERHPLIPVEDEGRLNDPVLRENFFERIYAFKRWKWMLRDDNSTYGFMQFHTRHKFMLMARGSSYYRELGRIVSGTTRNTLEQRRHAYIMRFMEVMTMRVTRGQQVNVMQHVMGFMRESLSREDKVELMELFEAYRYAQVPLITPITLLMHHARRSAQGYINRQFYLQPYPAELALRSEV